MNYIASILFIFLMILVIVFLLLLIAFLIFNYIPPLLLRGIAYVPTEKERIKKMIKFAAVKKGDKAVDLGSGDGCLILALARAGAEAHGYEINYILVLWSKLRIKKAGLSGKAYVHWNNLWKADLKDFNIVFIYGFDYMMKKLEEKLARELKPGARIVSNSFPLPTWPLSKKENGVYLYEKV